MAVIGEVLARGTRSSVHAYGRDAVAKVPARSTPDRWIEAEAAYAAAARAAGAPAPRLLAVERIGGRSASVWERVPGPTLWQCARERPERCAELGVLLADVQLALFALAPPVTLPLQRDRLANKLRRAPGGAPALPAVAGPPRVCHGDLHPSNVIMSPGGPVVVDGFDASRGDPVADIARSALLMALGGPTGPPRHLPGAARETLVPLARGHLARMRARLPLDEDALERWAAVEAAARLGEGVAGTALGRLGPRRASG